MPSTVTDRLYGENSNLAIKAPVVAVTNAPTSGPLYGLQNVNGYQTTGAANERVLVMNEANPVNNGIYNPSTTNWQRTGDFDGAYDVTQGTLIVVCAPSTTTMLYQLVTANPVIGSTPLNFNQFYPLLNPYPLVQAETDAGVTPTDFYYPVGDIRRYGTWYGNGINDDFSSWTALALVMAQGVNGYVPPGPTYVASQIVFHTPSEAQVSLYAYGVQLYTNNGVTANALDGLQFMGGGNSDSFTVYGITYFQLDASCTSGFKCLPDVSGFQGLATFVDCQVIISSTVAPNVAFACFQVNANGAGGGYWNKFIRCKTRQLSGNTATQAPFAFLLNGQANATTVRDCYVASVHYGVGLYADSGGNVGNAVLIDANHFEGGNAFAITVNGVNTVPASNVSGLRITNNRSESWTSGFLLLQNLGTDSAVPTFLAGNYLVSSAGAYLVQNNQSSAIITVNSWDQSITASYPGLTARLTNSGPFTFYNNNAGSGDSVIAEVANVGQGFSVKTNAGVTLGTFRYRSAGGCEIDFPAGGDYKVSGTQVLGAQIAGYGTPTGGSHQGSFAAGSITLPNLAAAVAQLIIDLKTHGMLGT